jgi:hypothetical protein
MPQPLHYHSAHLPSSTSPVFAKFQCLCRGPSLHCIHLCDRQKESELSIGPPFCCPNFFQTDWIVTTIVDIVNPVLGMVVPAEGLGVLERFPHAVHEPPHWMVLNLIQDPMRRHDLCGVVMIFGAMHQESLSFHHLNKHLRVAQRLCCHRVAINVVAGIILRQYSCFLIRMPMDAKLFKGHHSHRNTKAAGAHDDLTRTMNGLGHVEQKVDCL